MNRIRPTTFLTAAILVIVVPLARGESARELVAQGNEAFQKGEFEAALERYEEASVDLPESASLYFNRGAVLYKQEDYEQAEEAFKDAAYRSKEPGLSSRAKFNLGNVSFRRAQRQKDSDLKKAIEFCRESIAYYQEARDYDPAYKEAAENIEIVRLYVKVLLDEQKKRQEEQEQQDQEQENLVTKLKKLIERQGELVGTNQELATNKPDPSEVSTVQTWIDGLNALGEQQKTLQTDTGAILQEIQQTESQLRQQAAAGGQAPPPGPGQPAPAPAPDPRQLAQMEQFAGKLQEAAGHVNDAIANEQIAVDRLALGAQEPALDGQRKAVVDLEEAVKSLSDENQQEQQEGGQDQQNEDQEKQENEDQQQDQDKQEGDQEQEQEQQDGEQNEKKDQEGDQDQKSEEEQKEEAARAQMERAEDILDEEKKNQKRRPQVVPGRVQPVDRDW